MRDRRQSMPLKTGLISTKIMSEELGQTLNKCVVIMTITGSFGAERL